MGNRHVNGLAFDLRYALRALRKERMFAEYQALLEAAGFTDVEGRSTGAPLDVVFAVKR